MTKSLTRILCIADYYLPGFKGGGPIRTLSNLRDTLTGQAEICIFTRNHDLGSHEAYPGLPSNVWHGTEQGPTFYASDALFNAKGLQKAMAGQNFDLLYLNSFFSPKASIGPNLAFRKTNLPILLAPRGEFSQGALSLKAHKKKLFLLVAKGLGLYRDIFWHASTEHEAKDILRQFPGAMDRIFLAADPISFTAPDTSPASDKQSGKLRIAFISRLSPMKNLDGLLRILNGVKATIELNIFGPVEDEPYWAECQRLIQALPSHIKVHYGGTLHPDQVSRTFAKHDLFVFPTHGENFGHVIFEALRAGTPVLLSDQTPWPTHPGGAITTVALDDMPKWQEKIEEAAYKNAEQQQTLRQVTFEYARDYAGSDQARHDNLQMFKAVAAKKR